jgi:hypothetical protein
VQQYIYLLWTRLAGCVLLLAPSSPIPRGRHMVLAKDLSARPLIFDTAG